MNAKDLAYELNWLNPDTPIYVWIDGTRYQIHSLDVLDGYADINIKTEAA